MDVAKEIRCRLKGISKLLAEIEDILCKNNCDREEPKNASCACACVQESAGTDAQADRCENNVCSRTFKPKRKSHKTACPEEFPVKCEGWVREKSSTDFDDAAGLCCSRKSTKKNCDKMSSQVVCDILRNRSDKKNSTMTQKDRDREYLKIHFNDVRQKFLKYFDEINKDEPNCH